MKALNRAIARTVSQIARHAGEGCHVPMIMALENHLDALLTMERKMLEGVQELELPVPSNSLFAPQDSQYWTPERIAMFNRWENVQPPKNSNENTQPAPDVIDMTDPANWQVGDVVVRTCASTASFMQYENCTVTENNENAVRITSSQSGCSVTYPHGTEYDGAEHYFQWLRHGEARS